MRLSRHRACLLAAALALAAAGRAGAACPAGLGDSYAGEAAECRLLDRGVLRSRLGNADVAWRLFRRISGGGEYSPLYDAPPFDRTAVTLSPARDPDAPDFWSLYVEPGVAWFEPPYLAINESDGELLIVPGRVTGTGSGIDDHVFVPAEGPGWRPVDAVRGDAGWTDGLTRYLPPGHGVWKGIRVDYATLTGTTPVWRDGDANCCPSGGTLWFRLAIDDGPGLSVAEARYIPPDAGGDVRAVGQDGG